MRPTPEDKTSTTPSRSNEHHGGPPAPIGLTKKEVDAAIKAVSVAGLFPTPRENSTALNHIQASIRLLKSTADELERAANHVYARKT